MRLILIYIAILFNFCAFGQTLVDEFADSSNSAAFGNLVTEKVKMISPSKRIFVITNENNSFDKGDFLSVIGNGKIIARALAAKNQKGVAAIKILRINSLMEWNRLNVGSDIQIIRGDDSYFNTKKKDEAVVSDTKIKNEEDLFSTTKIVDDDLALEENKNRVIKTDNLVALSYGQIEAGTERQSQFLVQYGYQIEDNIWLEALYGQSIIRNYPSDGLDTKLTNFTLRGKYTISAPMYMVIQPYIGFQMKNAESPGAGQLDASDPNFTQTDADNELNDVEKLKKNGVIFGVTLLKRLVPGWFIKADLGSDIVSAGFSLEF